jgi:hypothetical protein
MRDKELDELEKARPEIELSERGGNAIQILVTCKRAARKFGCSARAIEELKSEMLGGDYQHVLNTANKYFDVS